MLRWRSALLALALLARAPVAIPAQERPFEDWPAAPRSERLDLSGPDAADPRPWRFRVSAGARAGEQATIPVPSQWELQGFGTYAYGQEKAAAAEEGFYALDFAVPVSWRGRRVELVFEGSMTDTAVEVNGVSAGPPHQGGFTRFRYDVTPLVRIGESNRLEVTVRERSANRSVEAAERDADYWTFGGIYRAVRLDAHPAAAIDHVAVDARADGELRAVVETIGAPAGARVLARVLDEQGAELARLAPAAVAADRAAVTGKVARAQTWSHERPTLHHLELRLETANGDALHGVARRFGFRSFAVRLDGPAPGLYVNGLRTLLKGVNRHSFRPESGRALSRAHNRDDAERIRALHFNAVRASHYPPDVEFLEACDELGLYVIDELPGWHDAYDDEVGAGLVAELVRRDVNHPSILLWANGNEGGWNTDLDGLFAEHDPQGRPVIHPWDDFGGLDTGHYPSWQELVDRLDDAPRGWLPWSRRAPRSLVLPTEALHGLFDGGGGASLGRYWRAISTARRGAGIFLWALLDEGVVRTDRGGEIDVFGNYAPDGILDPFRREEPSALAVREVFAPVAVVERGLDPRSPRHGTAGGSVTVHLENRFALRSLAETRIDWRALRFPDPFESTSGLQVLAAGQLAGPEDEPGSTTPLSVPWSGNADALELVVTLPAEGRLPALELARTVLPVASQRRRVARVALEAIAPAPEPTADGELVLERGGTRVVIDVASGELRRLERAGRTLPLSGGARPASGARTVVRATRAEHLPDRTTLEIAYAAGLQRAVWRVGTDGVVELSWIAPDDGPERFAGIVFEYPPERVESVTWLGGGPFSVWGNRLEGATLGAWRAPAPASADRVAVPLAGARAGVRWARLETADGELVIAPYRDPGRPAAPDPFLGLYRPQTPENPRHAQAELPDGISILHWIPPIGSKFHPGKGLVEPEDTVEGLAHGKVLLEWRPPAPPALPPTAPSSGG